MVAGGGGEAVRGAVPQFLIQLVALAMVPLLHASFSPPSWLRREWRSREEVALRHAMEGLLLYSPDRQLLAERALEWALRLMGAEAGMLLSAGDNTTGPSGAGRRRGGPRSPA